MKTKRLPRTKNEEKYLGPYLVSKVIPSHIVAQNNPTSSKTTRLHIHLSRKYRKRDPEVIIQTHSVEIGIFCPLDTLEMRQKNKEKNTFEQDMPD